MSPRIIHILEAFAKAYRETGKEQPIMVIARYVYTLHCGLPQNKAPLPTLYKEHIKIKTSH